MKNQRDHWNKMHGEQALRKHSATQTGFAEEVNDFIPAESSILELGCGEGNDSIYFATQGHNVTATDFSDVAVEHNKEQYPNDNLRFAVQDISAPLTFADNTFDVVYARLSLHYFSDEVTRAVFAEIKRVLKPGGSVCFMCKTTSDSIYGEGTEIEPDMYELNGHVRHFFSEPYVDQLLQATGLTAQKVVSGEEIIYDKQSAFIKVFAQK